MGTLRFEREHVNLGRNLSKGGNKVIYAFWHSELLMLGYICRDLDIHVLVSQHRDGELLSRVIRLFGYGTVRGSSTRGGVRALINMIKMAARGKSLMLAPDGPRGPRHSVQPGIILLAKKSGLPIIPVAAKVSRSWKMPSWDKFVLPKPFAKVTMIYGKAINVPNDIDDDQMQEYCKILEKELNQE